MEKTMTIAGLMHAAAFWALIIALGAIVVAW
jgi:hypothetical protein